MWTEQTNPEERRIKSNVAVIRHLLSRAIKVKEESEVERENVSKLRN